MTTPTQTAQMVISGMIIIGFGGVLIAWMIWPPSAENSNVLSAMVGAGCTAFIQVVNYWFQKQTPS